MSVKRIINIAVEAEEIDYNKLHLYRGKLVWRSPSRQDVCTVHGPYLVSVVGSDVWLIRNDEKLETKDVALNLFFEVTGAIR